MGQHRGNPRQLRFRPLHDRYPQRLGEVYSIGGRGVARNLRQTLAGEILGAKVGVLDSTEITQLTQEDRPAWLAQFPELAPKISTSLGLHSKEFLAQARGSRGKSQQTRVQFCGIIKAGMIGFDGEGLWQAAGRGGSVPVTPGAKNKCQSYGKPLGAGRRRCVSSG